MEELVASKSRDWGDAGEHFVTQSCTDPFGSDFVFRSPRYLVNGQEIELCDVLVLLNDAAVIVEVKTNDYTKRPSRTREEWHQLAQKRTASALAQVERAAAAIDDRTIRSVQNHRQGIVDIDAAAIRDCFALIVIDHPNLIKSGPEVVLRTSSRSVPTILLTHPQLSRLLYYLSTPTDLIDYMRYRHRLHIDDDKCGFSELDIFAQYILNNQEDNDSRSIVFANTVNGLWSDLEQRELDNRHIGIDPSRVIDIVLETLHTSVDYKPTSDQHLYARTRSESIEKYRLCANILAKIRRRDRAVIGKKYLRKATYASSKIEVDFSMQRHRCR